uniref:Ig-like domain-containing protein n=1 Tax=Pundamilia nyererei TaxID=303518 RepID=A0A3B4GPQ9_9CICH
MKQWCCNYSSPSLSEFTQYSFTRQSTGMTIALPCQVPKYVLFYRDNKLVPDYQHPSFKNRVDLQDRQMKGGDVSLILMDLTTDDAGAYECYVVQKGANHSKTTSLDVYIRETASPDSELSSLTSLLFVVSSFRPEKHHS